MSRLFSKIHGKAHDIKQRIHDEIDELQGDMSRLGTAVKVGTMCSCS